MKEDSETYTKAYPESFKSYFFRLIKTLSSKKAGSMKNAQVYKNSKALPTTFMVGAAPDPRHTFNKKLEKTEQQTGKMQATRHRIFYRDDKKKEMPAIFMSKDDQENCRFEPEAGSLNPKFWSLPEKKFPVP